MTTIDLFAFLTSFRVSAPQGILMATYLDQRADKEPPDAVKRALERMRQVCSVLDEEYAGRRATQNASALDVADLRSRLELMERAVGRGDLDTYHGANLAFHDRLVELAGNAKLLGLYRRLVNELSLHRRASLDQTGIPSVSLQEHRGIVDCIASGRAAAAGRLLHDHVMASRERMHRKTGAPLPAPKPRRARRSA